MGTLVKLALGLSFSIISERVEGSEAGLNDGIGGGSEERGFVHESGVDGLVESSVVAVSVAGGDENLAFLELVISSSSSRIGKLINAGVEFLNGKVAGGRHDVGIGQVVGSGFDDSFGETILVFLVVSGKIVHNVGLGQGDEAGS